MGRLFFIPILTLIINIYPLLFRILKSSFICTCWKDSLLPCGVLLFPFASFCYWRTFSLCCWWCSSSTATKNFYQRHLYTLFLLLLAFTGYVYFCFFLMFLSVWELWKFYSSKARWIQGVLTHLDYLLSSIQQLIDPKKRAKLYRTCLKFLQKQLKSLRTLFK